jgi:hypothetical protein
MDGIGELADAIHREKIERARRMSPTEKFFAGAELFEEACEISMQAIRNENRHFDGDQILVELKRRLECGRQLERRLAARR